MEYYYEAIADLILSEVQTGYFFITEVHACKNDKQKFLLKN